MIWFTSDWHLCHNNIIRYEDRPFKDLDEMQEVIISRHNEKVKEGDWVYVLGDVTFGNRRNTLELLYKMNGNMTLIKGNHDRKKERFLIGRFSDVYDYLELRTQGLVLSHYPILSWNGMYRGTIHIHGHSHGNLKPCYNEKGEIYTCKRLDVGVDCHDFYPLSLSEIREKLKNVQMKPIDHHEEEK